MNFRVIRGTPLIAESDAQGIHRSGECRILDTFCFACGVVNRNALNVVRRTARSESELQQGFPTRFYLTAHSEYRSR